MKIFHFGLALLLMLICGCVSPQASAQTTDVLALADNATKIDNLQIARDGTDVILTFDNPQASKGSITIPLGSLDQPLEKYDALHFDLLLEHGMVEPIITLWGYPNPQSSRRWFYKREATLGQWQHVRYELDLDDDGSMKKSKTPRQELIIELRRPVVQSEVGSKPATAKIRNVRLIKRPFTAELDPKKVSFSRENGRVSVHHLLELSNHSDQSLTLQPRVVREQGDASQAHFQPVDLLESITLSPGQSQTIDVTLQTRDSLPAGHVERAQLVVHAKEISDYTATPTRGYRPVYLYGFMPPEHHAAVQAVAKVAMESDENASLPDDAMQWQFDIPADVTPRYEDHFRCKTCGFRLRAKDAYHYDCHNKDCAKFNQTFEVKKDDPLLASYISVFHKESAATALGLARAWKKSGNQKQTQVAIDILTTYAKHYRQLPMPSENSTGFHSRLSSATLFEKDALNDFAQAMAILHDNPLLSDSQKQAIVNDLLLPSLYNVNLHHYGSTAGQVGFIITQLQAAAVTGNWWFMADSLGGDASVQSVLSTTFDGDGIGVEGGAYAKSAAERVITLASLLYGLGLSYDQPRVAQIIDNSRKLGILPGEAARGSLVLEKTGYTILSQGDGPRAVRTSINWGRHRERGEHDLLSFDFHDAQGQLVRTTGRIAYGNKLNKFMESSLAHNAPLMGQRDQPIVRHAQRVYENHDQWAGVLISDGHDANASKHHRTLMIIRGSLVVIDHMLGSDSSTLELPIYAMKDINLESSVRTAPGDASGKGFPYSVISDWRKTPQPVRAFRATSTDQGQPALSISAAAMDVFTLYQGRAIEGWTATPRDMLLIRKDASPFAIAVAYSSMRSPNPQVRSMKLTRAEDGSSVQCIVAFSDNRSAAVDVTFSPKPAINVELK